MSLSSFASPTKTTLELLHPKDGETPIGTFVTAFTPDSPEWKAAEKAQARKNPSKNKSIVVTKEGDQRHDYSEKDVTLRKALVISMITDITGKDEPDFTREIAEETFNDPQFQWAYLQLNEHLSDRANFFKQAEKPSKRTSKTSAG